MIREDYKEMLNAKSVIREAFMYAVGKGEEIGYENVFDYSLGNPSVPAPQEFTDCMIKLLQTENPVTLHGYSPSLGITSVRDKIAKSLNKRFGMDYTLEHIFMTTGAAGAVAHAVRCISKPGDKVITFAPYFPEYKHYIGMTGAELKVCPANLSNFQVNFEAFEEMLTSDVAAVLINTPNNPSGAAYSAETLTKMADLLYKKQKEFGHDIFIISDEPYREIVFEGADAPYVSKFYDNTLSCYSYSKALSLPGERIGYVAANPRCTDSEYIAGMCSQISRGTGHNCPPSIIQLAVAECVDMTSDLGVYEVNMNLIYNELVRLGFEVVKPGGTFYIFPKALEADAKVFCEKAKKYNLILVPSDSFGVEGYFRMSYCIETEKVERSLVAFREFVKNEYGRE